MVKIETIQDLDRLKPPFFIKDTERMMSTLYYSEKELGYNKEEQAWVNPDLAWTSYLRTGDDIPTLKGTPFAYRHINIVEKDDWVFLAHPTDMAQGKLIAYTGQEMFQQSIKSIFQGAVPKRSK